MKLTTTSPEHTSQFSKVIDGRKQPIRGLWLRNEKFYAQITQIDSASGNRVVRRVPLKSTTVSQAKLEMQQMQDERRHGIAVATKRAPRFDTFADEYISKHAAEKSPSTLKVEAVILKKLKQRFGSLTMDRITPALVNHFVSDRKAEGVSGRTVNLNVTILRNVLNKAKDLGLITTLPTDGIKKISHKSKRRPLLTSDEIDRVCNAAVEHTQNGQQFADYVRYLAYTGARSTEAMHVQWHHIDFDRQQNAFHKTKNGEIRDVDFNSKLQVLLADMNTRRLPDSPWLFPSCRNEGEHAKSFRETLSIAREKAGVHHFRGFHLLRHYFISQCVMAGIDYMTIAKWVGHKDGGVLIGKVYGHLNNSHTLAQAQKLKL